MLVTVPWTVAQAMAEELPGALGIHFAVSLWRVVASILVAIATAAPAGLALGQSRRLNNAVAPFVLNARLKPLLLRTP